MPQSSTPLRTLAAAAAAAEFNATEVRRRNDEIDAINLRVTREDANQPEGQRRPMLPHVAELTAEEFGQQAWDAINDNWAQRLKDTMAQAALARIATLAPELQAQVMGVLGLAYVAQITDPAGRAEAMGALALAKFLALPTEQQNALAGLVYGL